MSARPGGFLELLDASCHRPTYLVTRAVQTECVRHGLSEWLAQLEEAGRLEVCKTDYRQASRRARALEAKLGGLGPGANDMGLLILAQERHAPLITDDAALYSAAIAEGVVCLDLLDVCLAAEHEGDLVRSETLELFAYLRGPAPHYLPIGWKALRQQGYHWPVDHEQLTKERRPAAELCTLLFR